MKSSENTKGEPHTAATPEIPSSLAGQFKRHVPAYAGGLLTLGAFQLAMNRIDWFSKDAIDRIFGPFPKTAWVPASQMFVLAVVAFLTRVASRWLVFNAGRDVEFDLRNIVLDRLHTLGTAFYRKMSAGEIMSRATGDLVQVRLLFGFGVLNVINVVFATASALQVMLRISPRLALIALLPVPVLILLTRSFSRLLFSYSRAAQQTLGRLSDVTQGNLAGVRVVRSLALEKHELERFQKVNAAYLDASLGLARIRGSMFPMMGAASATGVLLFFWYGASLLSKVPADGGITRGGFFAFSLALGRMAWPMIALGFTLSIVQRGRAGYNRLKEILDAVPEVVDGPLPAPPSLAGRLDVTDLSFSYGNRKVLDGVSLSVGAGQSLAIVGRTGSGKSTLAMLLARLLPTPPGTVRLDGFDVCDLPLSSVRATVGYAQQEAFLFSTTVSRNIGFSIDDVDSPSALERIREAARESQVLEEALELPEQFDTVVGERGVQLSGGQKQRIALARALVWEPKILLLDDPLSAVDARTEARILQAIERQAAARTVILITNRIAAAARCDSIIVLDQGKVIERGTNTDLIQAGGLYAAFAEEQRMKRELEEIELDDSAAKPSSGAA